MFNTFYLTTLESTSLTVRPEKPTDKRPEAGGINK